VIELTPISVPRFARSSDYAGLWSIEPLHAERLHAIASRTNWGEHFEEQTSERKSKVEVITSPVANAKQIAVVRLDGSLMKAESSLGGTSTVQARRDIRKAVADSEIGSILLAIDSPGGTVAGTDDLAKEVAAANKLKPVYAFVSDLCASAAYWVGSQCEAIYANSSTAWIGSIGTMLTIYDLGRAADTAGVEVLVFGTGPLKGAGTEGTKITEEQRAYFQSLVNRTQPEFDAAVSRGRSFNSAQLAAVKTGGVFDAKEALALGLIDGIQSLEATLSMLAKASKDRAKQSGSNSSGRQQASSTTLPTPQHKGDGSMSQESTSDTVDQLVEERRSMAAEIRRVSAIKSVCADNQEIAADAIEKGWTPEAAELAVLKAKLNGGGKSAPPAANPHKPSQGSGTAAFDGDVMAAAITSTINRSVAAKRFSADLLNRAESAYRGGVGIQECLLLAARENGYTGRASINAGNLEEVLRAGFPPRGMVASTGFTTNSLSGILSNVANKFLLDGYQSGEEQWRQIARVGSVRDFKTMTSYRMTGAFVFEEVGPAGDLKHGRMGEESYSNQAKTYGRIAALTRQQIINDDLGAFADVPREIGRGAIDKINSVFWSTFLGDHGNFFQSSATGTTAALTRVEPNLTASSALGAAALTAAKTLFLKQVRGDGTPLNLMPYALVVPPELQDTATVLLRDRELRDNTANRVYVAANPHAGSNLVIVTSPYLSNSAMGGGQSATSWYLIANPAQTAAIEVVFLDGQQSPVIEQADADFATLGIQMRGYFDFGVARQDRRAAVKATA
jgi:signal peptide peptidase SppA